METIEKKVVNELLNSLLLELKGMDDFDLTRSEKNIKRKIEEFYPNTLNEEIKKMRRLIEHKEGTYISEEEKIKKRKK